MTLEELTTNCKRFFEITRANLFHIRDSSRNDSEQFMAQVRDHKWIMERFRDFCKAKRYKLPVALQYAADLNDELMDQFVDYLNTLASN
jgi:hypothetical protein